MIKLLRIDQRLLHGQVGLSWAGYLDANCILIANDECSNNELRKSVMKLAKPRNCKLIIKSIKESIEQLNSGIADKYNLFIVVDSVEDGYNLAKSVDRITVINVGGLPKRKDSKPYGGNYNINLTCREVDMLKELEKLGKKVELRMVPKDPIYKL